MKTLKNLMPFARDLVSVTSSATLEEIQTLMLSKGVSMIPIIDHNTRNVGLVRRKAIWKWLITKNQNPLLENVREKKLPELLERDSLESAMQILKNNSAILIKNKEGKFEKILTPKSTAEALNWYSERFYILEELEKNIRNIISKFTKTKILKALSVYSQNKIYQEAKNTKEIIKLLNFEDYKIIFRELWEEIGLINLDKKIINNMLEEVRLIRNDTMHFRFTESNHESLNKIKDLNKLLI